eukprot:1890816-Pyramimonas_sp.AAC.1
MVERLTSQLGQLHNIKEILGRLILDELPDIPRPLGHAVRILLVRFVRGLPQAVTRAPGGPRVPCPLGGYAKHLQRCLQ